MSVNILMFAIELLLCLALAATRNSLKSIRQETAVQRDGMNIVPERQRESIWNS